LDLQNQRLLSIAHRRQACSRQDNPIVEDTFLRQPAEAPLWAKGQQHAHVIIPEETVKGPQLPIAKPSVVLQPKLLSPARPSHNQPPEDLLGSSFEERKLVLEKQRAELEANKRAFEEFGMRSQKQLADLLPLEMEHRIARAASKPDMEAPAFTNHSLELAKSRLSRIHELIDSVKSGLDGVDDLEDEFEAPNEKPVFMLNNVEVSFPVVADSDSLTYRAEAIRAFLEKELGLQKLLDLRDEVDDQHHGRPPQTQLSKEMPSGFVVLMWHLITLDEMILGI
jgi:hypothetical protein